MKNFNENYETIVSLQDKSKDTGAGMEYGILLTVKRGKEKRSKYYKYRDGHSASGDNWNFCFRKAEVIEETPEKVTVRLYNGDFTLDETFDLQTSQNDNQESKDPKMNEAIEKLKKYHKEKYANASYPLRHTLAFIQGQFVPNPDLEFKYDGLEVLDVFENPEKGEGIIVTKAQIDARADNGKQYEFCVYFVKEGVPELKLRQCAYETNLDKVEIPDAAVEYEKYS